MNTIYNSQDNSSRVYPIANLLAIFAIGYPVALEAKAEERETLGFISIAIISSFLTRKLFKIIIFFISKKLLLFSIFF